MSELDEIRAILRATAEQQQIQQQRADAEMAALRQIVESNSRAIEANSASISSSREIVMEGFNAAARDIQRLAEFILEGFRLQGQTNHNLLDRVDALEQEARGDTSN